MGISYCNEDMLWMQEYFDRIYNLKNIKIQNTFIYSKCVPKNKSHAIEGYTPPGSTIFKLPNVGRCDHNIAHFMSRMNEEDAADDNHYVIFLKASRYLYQKDMQYRPLVDQLRIAAKNGFSCEAEPTYQSLYYNTTTLRQFHIKVHREEKVDVSNYTNMGQWLDNLGIELPSPITPVCFGANFVVKSSQIFSKRDIWKKIEISLERGNNIVEGHYAERSWAGILSNHLSPYETDILNSIPRKTGNAKYGYIGHMVLDE